ncbi:MAG: YihY/virulence factor BrkB family protein, partial [Janthinobacterium lividum]
LVISAGPAAMADILNTYLPGAAMVMRLVNFVISLGMISVLFGAIYKILPDKPIEWRDVIVGAVTTALLFTIGKTAISVYIGSSTVASSFGAAGALAVMLVWIYYSSQIFLLGAEFTRAYAERHGSKAAAKIAVA